MKKGGNFADIRARCTQDLWDRLCEEAERRAISRRRILDAALREWLSKHENEVLVE